MLARRMESDNIALIITDSVAMDRRSMPAISEIYQQLSAQAQEPASHKRQHPKNAPVEQDSGSPASKCVCKATCQPRITHIASIDHGAYMHKRVTQGI